MLEQQQWMGVDLGNARIGIALSDPDASFAYPAGNIAAYGDSFRALDDVITFIEEHGVSHVVIGLPLSLDGSMGASAKKARRWAANLERRIQEYVDDDMFDGVMPSIVMQDERMTTVSAHRMLLDAQVASTAHRPRVDQQSAVLILQTALDRYRQDGDLSDFDAPHEKENAGA